MAGDFDFEEMLVEFDETLVATTVAVSGLLAPNERGLEDALERELLSRVGCEDSWSGVSRQLRVTDSDWPGVGAVDLALEPGGDERPVLVELKWNDLHACSWDMAKLALCCAKEHADYGILVAAAPVEHWETNPGKELFDQRSWRADVLLDRFGSSFAYWASQVKTRPKRLPASWVVTNEMRVPFEHDLVPWELRAVTIEVPDPKLVYVAYVPVAAGAAYEARTRPYLAPSVKSVEGTAEDALRYFAAEEEQGERTVVAAEGGSFLSVELVGLAANEAAIADGDDPKPSTRWFRSPADRRAYLEQRSLLPRGSQRPDHFEINAGSGLGPGFVLRWIGRHLALTRRPWSGEPTEDIIEPTDAQWHRLWRTLDLLDAWSWAPAYEPASMVTDGHGWSVDIAYIGRRCQSGGYEAYPGGSDDSPTWAAFELALEDLISLPLYRE